MNRLKPETGILFPIFGLILICLVGIIAYAGILDAPFQFDDYPNIVENNSIKIQELKPAPLLRAMTESPSKNRWLPNLSFALNYYYSGLNPGIFRGVNVITHILSAMALFFLANTILSLPKMKDRFDNAREIALAASLLWLVHPLQTNTVTYIVQRMSSMASLFFLLSVLFYFQARLKVTPGYRRIMFYTVSAAAGFLAVISKENAAMLPLMILSCELFFLQDNPELKPGRILLISLGVSFIFYCLAWIYMDSEPFSSLLGRYAKRDFTLVERLLTEPRIILFYLTLIILPLPSRLNLAHDPEISTSLISPIQTLPSILLLGCLALLIPVLFKKNRLLSFAVLWYLGNLLIESSVIPLEIIFEHRINLPAVFLIISGTAELYRFFSEKIALKRSIIIVIGSILLIFTWQRNAVWSDEVSLWNDVVKKSPDLARGYENLGVSYKNQNRLEEAEQNLLKAIELDPETGSTYMNLGVVYQLQNRMDDSLNMLFTSLDKKNVNKAGIHNNIGIVFARQKQYREAVQQFFKAIGYDPYMMNARINLGLAYRDSGNNESAEQVFREAVAMDSRYWKSYYHLGEILEKTGRLEESLQVLNESSTKAGAGLAEIHGLIGIVYWRQGRYQLALDACHKSLQYNPDNIEVIITMAMTYEDSGRIPEAREQYRSAWGKGYDVVGLFNNWAERYMKAGNPQKAMFYLRQALEMNPDHVLTNLNLTRAKSQVKPSQLEAE